MFLVLHLFVSASILRGEGAFRSVVGSWQRSPAIGLLVTIGILVPLAFHAGYGLVLAIRERKSPSVFPERWWAVTQRATGAIAFVFVLLHLWDTTLSRFSSGAMPVAFQSILEARLSTTTWGVPWIAMAYMIGIAATCFHFAAGLWSFTVVWGLSPSSRAKRRVAFTSGAVGIVLFGMGALTVVKLATGAHIVEIPEPMPDGSERPACTSAPP